MQGKKCKLAIGTLNNIVAHGLVIVNEIGDAKIHGSPLGDKNYRVAITLAKKKEALIPIPVGDEIHTVGEALGGYVAWPKQFVLLDNEPV